MLALKSLSMSRFLGKLIEEEADWSNELKGELKPEESEVFKRHL